jgi:hypothetical protein
MLGETIMIIKQLPFNIEILDTNSDIFKTLPRVTSMDIFDGATKNFNKDGLFSIEYFGKFGEERRNRAYAYIDLGVTILHPIIHKALCDLKELYGGLMKGTDYAVWDPNKKDFIKSDPVEGETGYSFFISHLDEIVFEERPSIKRSNNILLVKSSLKNKKAVYSKRVVMPAGLRDFEVDKSGKQSQDEVNDYYRKLIASSNLVNPMAVKTSIKSLDPVRNTMQNTSNELHEYLISMLDGKKKLTYDKWASRKAFDTTRNVITAMIDDIKEIGDPKSVSSKDTVVGMYQYTKAIMPLALYQVKNGLLSQVFTSSNTPMFMVNKKTLSSDSIPVDPDLYDQWMTDEGLEKTLTKFGEEDLRHMELGTKDHWFMLIYKDDSKYITLKDIKDLPEGLDPNLVKPITFAELLYLSIAPTTKGRYCLVTRYPITGFGSIYPSNIYLRSTTKSYTLEEYDLTNQPTGIKYYNFPITGEPFVNSMSPSNQHLGLLGADFDGDVCSFTVLLTAEANAEAERVINDRNFYISSDGNMNFSSANDTINVVLDMITGEPEDVDAF